MKIDFITKNYLASEKLKDVISHKVSKLDKFFGGDEKVKILLKETNNIFTLEITLNVENAMLRAEVSGDNMYDNIDIALPKLEKQIIKHREKIATKSKKFRIKDLDMTVAGVMAEEKIHGVVKSKTYQLVPMTVEDAIAELELIGHSFYVFSNKVTASVNVVYKRNDGDYGLIETVV